MYGYVEGCDKLVVVPGAPLLVDELVRAGVRVEPYDDDGCGECHKHPLEHAVLVYSAEDIHCIRVADLTPSIDMMRAMRSSTPTGRR